MRKKIFKKVQQMVPSKMLRGEQFAKRVKNHRRHQHRYNSFSYRHSHKPSRFNRWEDYKRFVNRYY